MFAGSYLGGIMTLIGVVLTLQYERKLQHQQTAIGSIDKEKGVIASVVGNIETSMPSRLYMQCMTLKSFSGLGVDALEIGAFRNQIMLEQEKINRIKTRLILETNLYNFETNCKTCKQKCQRNEITRQITLLLDQINSKMFDTLNMIDSFLTKKLIIN